VTSEAFPDASVAVGSLVVKLGLGEGVGLGEEDGDECGGLAVGDGLAEAASGRALAACVPEDALGLGNGEECGLGDPLGPGVGNAVGGVGLVGVLDSGTG